MTRPDGSPHPHQGMQLADWWPRVGASILDGIAVWSIAFVAFIIGGLTSEVVGNEDVIAPVWLLVWFIAASAYYVGLMTRKGAHNGQTLGKQALEIRVVRDNGQPMGAGITFVREVLLKFVLANILFGLGWVIDSLWPLGERENRALHDLAVSTHVVRTRNVVRPQIPQPPQPVAARPQLAPPIARHVEAAHRIQAGIAAAVQRAQLPYVEVSNEVSSLMGLLWHSAQRAQMLYEALEESPVARVEQRLQSLSSGERPELAAALQEQLTVQRRMATQLDRYDGEMERIVVELDTVRSNLISVSASTDVDNQEQLAERVRGLRDEMSAVAEGMDQAYG